MFKLFLLLSASGLVFATALYTQQERDDLQTVLAPVPAIAAFVDTIGTALGIGEAIDKADSVALDTLTEGLPPDPEVEVLERFMVETPPSAPSTPSR